MKRLNILSLLILGIFIFAVSGSTSFFLKPFGIADDINNKYTSIGNIALTVTNYGTIGKGYCPPQPSGQYPKGSGIEHVWLGGLWLGGIKQGVTYVSTAAVDNNNANRNEGFEFSNNPGMTILERSRLQTSPYYRPDAVSDQDFVCDFLDTNTVINGTIITNHHPLGLQVHLESYTYDLNFANFFVILNYKITNIGYNGNTATIDSIYAGMWSDCVVRNVNIAPNPCSPGTDFYSHGANGYVDTMGMQYVYDYNSGDFADSYGAIKVLGVSPKAVNDTTSRRTSFTIWQYKNGTDPVYFYPVDDIAKYSKLKGFLSPGTRMTPERLNVLSHTSGNRVTLISYGPFLKTDGQSFSLRYAQDTLNIVFAVVCAKKYGTDPATFDSVYQRKTLFSNAGWAQRSYDNGYKLPSPPDIPKVRTEVKSQDVTLWWTNNAENSVDPISGKKDFEGYKIYRTNAGADLTLNQDLTTALKLIADFDSAYNNYSNNTGFGFIKQNTPKQFDGDTNKYWYKFDFPNQLNGFQYIYSVTAYDKGDSAQNLDALESSLIGNAKRLVVGTVANDNEDVEIGVYPNPYYGSAIWDGAGAKKESLRKIYFFNLPSQCEISIWTLSGDLVDRFKHDAGNYNGSDIQWFKTFSDGTQVFPGGEHAWDLISKNEQAVASGLYLFTVKDDRTGKIKKGKFLIVK